MGKQETPEETIARLTKENADQAGKIGELTTANTELNKQVKALTDKNADTQKALDDLTEESTKEIERLSAELATSNKEAQKSTLSVSVKGVRYTTPAGRKYNIKGNEIAAEDLVKDVKLCAELIEKKSGIFKK